MNVLKASESGLESLIQREQQETLALASDVTSTLSKLNISIENLPQKCQQLLFEVATLQTRAGVSDPDMAGLSLCHSTEMMESMDDEYEILKLRQKNKELQAKIDRNALEIESLRRDLAESRLSLKEQDPSPDNIQQYCRQLRQKLTSYDDSYQRAKSKYSALGVPSSVQPRALVSGSQALAALVLQAGELRRRADDVRLAARARQALSKLRK